MNNWIIISNYPGHSPIIDGTGIPMTDYGLVSIFDSKYIKITGITFKNSNAYGLYSTRSSHLQIVYNTFDNTWFAATILQGQLSGNVTDITFNHNIVRQAHMQGLFDMGGEGITLGMGMDGFEIAHNIVTNSRAGVIDTKNGIWNGKVHHNIISTSEYSAIYVDGFAGGAGNIDIYDNVMFDMVSSNQNMTCSGFAIASEQGGIVENIRFYNNLIYNNPANAIEFPWYGKGIVRNIYIINNTIYNNGTKWSGLGGIFSNYPPATGIVIRNNIVSQNREFQIRTSNTNDTIDHNLIDGFRGYPLEVRGTNYIEGNPQFVNPSAADFHLNSDSLAIDAGIPTGIITDFDGKPRPQGAGVDIGAFEYTPIQCIPNWQCEYPLNRYENDGCGNRRLNSNCNPACIPNWKCELPLNGYEQDGCGNRRPNSNCNPPCVPNWVCELPLNGYEKDNCGNRRLNPSCAPSCVPVWSCELPLNGWEADGCGNRQLNIACNPIIPPPKTSSNGLFVLGLTFLGYIIIKR